jgi:hypothetical protein
MKASRIAAIILAVGGLPWAILLLMYVVGISVHSSNDGARFAGIWIPGFACYAVWLARAFAIPLGCWRHALWLGAVGVNIAYLAIMFPVSEFRWNDGFGVVARAWLLAAAALSLVGFFLTESPLLFQIEASFAEKNGSRKRNYSG